MNAMPNISPVSFERLKDESFTELANDYGDEAVIDEGTENTLRAVELADFLAMELPPRELILSPWLPKAGLCMIHARPGVGKTHLSLNIAYSVATGSPFLNWRVDHPKGVLFIDGEMPAAVLQERLAQIVAMHGHRSAPKKLLFVTPDFQDLGMPDLGTTAGQNQINHFITDDIDLVIVDNLSCLVRTGKENDSDSWQPVQTWALNLRAKGKSVLFIHHSSKGGVQRGSSKKEDVLDTVISLKRGEDYSQDKGACFIVSFEKARGFHGNDAKPFEAQLATNPCGKTGWVTRSLEESTYDKVVSLLNDGLSQKEISDELKISKGTVSKYVKRAKEEGLCVANKEKGNE